MYNNLVHWWTNTMNEHNRSPILTPYDVNTILSYDCLVIRMEA